MSSGDCTPESLRTSTVPGSNSGELSHPSPAVHGKDTAGVDDKLTRAEVEEELVNSYQDLLQCVISLLVHRLLLYVLNLSKHGTVTLELPNGEIWQIISQPYCLQGKIFSQNHNPVQSNLESPLSDFDSLNSHYQSSPLYISDSAYRFILLFMRE